MLVVEYNAMNFFGMHNRYYKHQFGESDQTPVMVKLNFWEFISHIQLDLKLK